MLFKLFLAKGLVIEGFHWFKTFHLVKAECTLPPIGLDERDL